MSKIKLLLLVGLIALALVPVIGLGNRGRNVSPNGESNQAPSFSSLVAEADAALVKLAVLERSANDEPANQDTTQIPVKEAVNKEAASLDANVVDENSVAEVASQKIVLTPAVEVPPVGEPEEVTEDDTPKIPPLEQPKEEIKPLVTAQLEMSNPLGSREVQERVKSLLDENENLRVQLKILSEKSLAAAQARSGEQDLRKELNDVKNEREASFKIITELKRQKADVDKRLIEEQKLRSSVEQRMDDSGKKAAEQIKENDKLKRAVSEFEKRIKLLEEQRLAESEEKEQVLMKQVAALRKDLSLAQTAAEDLKKKQSSYDSNIQDTKGKLEDSKNELVAKQKEADDLSLKLAAAQQLTEHSSKLENELVLLKNELMLAQEQVKTLMMTSATRSQSQHNTIQNRPVAEPPVAIAPRQQPPSAAGSGEYFVQVVAPKANLRAGPGEDNSPVLEVQSGTILVAESRQGEWFKVVGPKGQRAWIRSDLVVPVDPATGRLKGGIEGSASRPAAPRAKDPITEMLERQKQQNGAAQEAPPPTANRDEEEEDAFESLKKELTK